MNAATSAREADLQATTPAVLRAIAWRRGKPFPTPRTAAERRAIIAWILAAEQSAGLLEEAK